jgi:hypothetical protein
MQHKNLAAVRQPSNYGGGAEFGSNKKKQFPVWSGREGRGSRGWFIYPTLRAAQPHIINEWEQAFSKIVKRYN